MYPSRSKKKKINDFSSCVKQQVTKTLIGCNVWLFLLIGREVDDIASVEVRKTFEHHHE